MKVNCLLPEVLRFQMPHLQIMEVGPTGKREEGRPREYTRPRTNVHEDIRSKERSTKQLDKKGI
ncbi:hypothetical protein DAPPUDRAFT_246439 [Daphnia pulex]|uniref:Uncharacterized protein n=2 Tax=Daphnia pulex TaxID=6669 RepID=E9GQI2_DAPPU|nr:hypothetical protein DAPPUDRAFT_246439 [Daphnia pulex]|eukprot:EFX78329.1 hypothetical protein DAPPUDRAFT_246439 [Daphnia pulex]